MPKTSSSFFLFIFEPQKISFRDSYIVVKSQKKICLSPLSSWCCIQGLKADCWPSSGTLLFILTVFFFIFFYIQVVTSLHYIFFSKLFFFSRFRFRFLSFPLLFLIVVVSFLVWMLLFLSLVFSLFFSEFTWRPAQWCLLHPSFHHHRC